MSRIVAICPGNALSGGPEALHQLVDMVNQIKPGLGAITYLPFEREFETPETFKRYSTPILRRDQIQRDDYIVIPESIPRLCNDFANRKVLWWLSVDFAPNLPREFFIQRDLDSTIHAVQSEYARRHLLNLTEQTPISLTDYIAKDFSISPLGGERNRRIVLSFKGEESAIEFQSRLPDREIIRIDGNMSREEVAELLQSSLIYIDLGSHPGRDRLPREAAMSGCVVLSTNRGSAANNVDMPLPVEYKFADLDSCLRMVEEISSAAEIHFERQSGYRAFANQGESTFRGEVTELINRLSL